MSRPSSLRGVTCAVGVLAASAALAYPLDGYQETGIRRLEGIRLAQTGAVRDVKQPPGALLNLQEVDLRLVGQNFDLPAPDPELTRSIGGLMGGTAGSYGFAVLDLTDPKRPRYAERNGTYRQNVGKIGRAHV